MNQRTHRQPGRFKLLCLLRHRWTAWAGPILRHYPFPSLDTFLWEQRTCSRCTAQQGKETPNL